MSELFVLITATVLLLGSPGPVPIALAFSGAKWGIKASIPFLTGILVGLLVVISLTGAGLSGIIILNASTKVVFTIASVSYFVYVAYKIASASSTDQSQSVLTFSNGFVLNLTNPKAYAAFMALFSQFSLNDNVLLIDTLVTGAVCFVVAIIVDTIWLLAGRPLSFLLTSRHERHVRVFFAAMLVCIVLYSVITTTNIN